MGNKALVVYSGGLDSTVLLKSALEEYDTVEAISFYYGAKHNNNELIMARKQCNKLEIKHTMVTLDFIGNLFKSDLLSNGGEIPEGHYAAENMKSTVVPLRNGIMLMIACGYADSHGIGNVLLASHAGDHYIYPDCRPKFNQYLTSAVLEGTEGKVTVKFPFATLNKAEIVVLGSKLGVDFKNTWSCYKGGRAPCGKCGTCVERKEAFELAGVNDPNG